MKRRSKHVINRITNEVKGQIMEIYGSTSLFLRMKLRTIAHEIVEDSKHNVFDTSWAHLSTMERFKKKEKKMIKGDS